MPPSKRNQRINDILTGTKLVLDTTKDLLNLSPIPGLPIAASALSAIIGLVLKTRGNEDAREELAQVIVSLKSVIEETMRKAESVLWTDNLTRNRLMTSPELKERVSTLENDLNGLTEQARKLQGGSGIRNFLLSSRNADILLNLKTGIQNATTKFQIQSGITVEMLINGVVDDIALIKLTQHQELDAKALDKLPHVNAGYTSASNPTKSGTLPGTRTALLEELMEWTLRPDSVQDDSFMYVVSGGAGTGKSTIAFEMARRLEEVGALGASFFFVNGNKKLNTTKYVLTTIAYQLAHKQPDLYPHIAAAARYYSKQGKEAEQLQVELEDLIIEPLMNVSASHRPITLILDALDESAQDEVVRLLNLLVSRLTEIPFPVRVLVTTRPEMHIEDALNTEKLRKVSKPYKLHEIPREIVDEDIKLFFEAKLGELNCRRIIFSARPNVIEDLTKLAGGLFIYADTVVKFLGSKPDLVVEILDSLLSNDPSNATFSLKNLDRLYITVLHSALGGDVSDMEGYIQVVLGSLALVQDNVSTGVLQDLVDIPIGFIRYVLSRLGSVILKPENDDVDIQVLHASFPQFLVDKKRCNDPIFHINPSTHHHRLALTCLNMMTVKSPLRRNICNLRDPTKLKTSFHGLDEGIPGSVQYSCIHWATHLSRCDVARSDILNVVKEFTRTKLLVWVEVLSYMDKLEVAVPALLTALSWCEANIQGEDRNEILQLIDDAHRLILQFYTPINQCPEHIYISALQLAPSCVLTTHYNNAEHMPTIKHPIMELRTPRDLAWGACLLTIPMESRFCRAILSPDGTLIASGLSSGEVCIWDASIGLSGRTLRGHTEGVKCVAWSPNGKSLASGSADGTFRIWNPTSGAQIHCQRTQKSSCGVFSISWSPDGKRLVTASEPGGLQVWNITLGKKMKQLIAVPSIVSVMAISKDALRAVDITYDNVLRFWDISGDDGRILQELHPKSSIITALFLHNDKQVAFFGTDRKIRIWDLKSGTSTSRIELKSKVTFGGQTYIYGIAVSPDGNILASSTADKIHFFNTRTWDSLGSFQGVFRYTASFSPDCGRLLTSYDVIQMWDSSAVLAPKPQITPSIAPPTTSSIMKHDSLLAYVGISPDGSRVVAVSDEAVSIWTLQSGLLFCVIQGDISGSVVFSPDSHRIAVAAYRKTCIWDITTAEPVLIRTIPNGNHWGDKIAWSPDGKWIASVASGPVTSRQLGVFDAMTGELEITFPLSNNEGIWEVEFSSDSSLLFVECGTDMGVFRWKEGERLDIDHYGWETERVWKMRYYQDGWIIRERDEKRLCWVPSVNADNISWWGSYYAVGKLSGQLEILHIRDS